MSAQGAELLALRYGAGACLALAVAVLAFALGLRPPRILARVYGRYVADLDTRLRLLFIDARGSAVALAQLAAALLLAGASVALGKPALALWLAVIAFLPRILLERAQRRRRQKIEEKLDGFVLALANALRANPSIGAALASVLPMTQRPIDQELELLLREMRVGSTIEQALLGFGQRADSLPVDAVLSSLLIGRKVGGNVPEILENTASSLREMARLAGVLRAKTAEGRVQTTVLAVFPLVLVFAFDALSPGYFDPLTRSATGVTIIAISVCFWVVSVLLARRIMAVAL